MAVYELDPLQDPRWAELVQRHADASVFHTMAWLAALQRTYGYQPVVLTTSPPADPLHDGVALCKVRSWLTGHRLVSLPFADHCEPLVHSDEALHAIAARLDEIRRDGEWRYVELRPRSSRLATTSGLAASDRFWMHDLALLPTENALFGRFQKDSIQRKIHRARREDLSYEEGLGETLLREFYRLLLLTRRRHQLPPQPLDWFRNLAECFESSMKVRVARRGDTSIAAIVTLRHRDVMVYKYGASDAALHHLGGMHLLLWNTIKEARATGCTSLDLGRCETDNQGLAIFKERWGAVRSEMTYWRYGGKRRSHHALRAYAINGARRVLGHAPDACRVAAGRFLYKHAG
jgi:CelD/BcsL family acetyltransferase involved in cellulose biosynthesis